MIALIPRLVPSGGELSLKKKTMTPTSNKLHTPTNTHMFLLPCQTETSNFPTNHPKSAGMNISSSKNKTEKKVNITTPLLRVYGYHR